MYIDGVIQPIGGLEDLAPDHPGLLGSRRLLVATGLVTGTQAAQAVRGHSDLVGRAAGEIAGVEWKYVENSKSNAAK